LWIEVSGAARPNAPEESDLCYVCANTLQCIEQSFPTINRRVVLESHFTMSRYPSAGLPSNDRLWRASDPIFKRKVYSTGCILNNYSGAFFENRVPPVLNLKDTSLSNKFVALYFIVFLYMTTHLALVIAALISLRGLTATIHKDLDWFQLL